LSPEELILPFHEQGGTPTGHSRRIIGAAAGRMHAILLTEDNCVFAFGSGEDGQVGVDCVHTEDTWVHVPIPKTEKISKVYCGAYHSAAITEDCSVWLWGSVIPVSGEKKITPEKIESLPPVCQLACGWDFILALTLDGRVYGWGRNGHGELGLGPGSDATITSPVLIPGLSEIAEITSGSAQAFAVTKKGALYSWGIGGVGECCFTPTLVFPSGIHHVATGEKQALALCSDGSVLGWGTDILVSKIADVAKKNAEFEGTRVVGIGCGESFSWVMTGDGKIFLWGEGSDGEMGNGTMNACLNPTLLENWEFQIPIYFNFWGPVFQWLFLGSQDQSSNFFGLPKEVLFNFAGLFF